MSTDNEVVAEFIWARIRVLAAGENPEFAMFFGLMMGMRLQSSDPELAKLIFDSLLSDKHMTIVGTTDQIAALMRRELGLPE
jgi:hypothetical protein